MTTINQCILFYVKKFCINYQNGNRNPTLHLFAKLVGAYSWILEVTSRIFLVHPDLISSNRLVAEWVDVHTTLAEKLCIYGSLVLVPYVVHPFVYLTFDFKL